MVKKITGYETTPKTDNEEVGNTPEMYDEFNYNFKIKYYDEYDTEKVINEMECEKCNTFPLLESNVSYICFSCGSVYMKKGRCKEDIGLL